MTLDIETFSAVRGGNSFFKALTHPEAATRVPALLDRLGHARRLAIYDPHDYAAGFAACYDIGGLAIDAIFVQSASEISSRRLHLPARPIVELVDCDADLVFAATFDAGRLMQQIGHLLPAGAGVVTLDEIRLADSRLTNRQRYLDPLNFATNFAFFRDAGGHHTRVVGANYWSSYGAKDPTLSLILFDAEGHRLAAWHETLGGAEASFVLDSAEIRQRFALPEFEGQLFIHVIGAHGHDVVKYALDTYQTGADGHVGESLSCTHDANAWPADFYAGLPAPRDDEQVILWVQNSLPIPIPAGTIALNLMGGQHQARLDQTIAPFASLPLDTRALMPEACWPEQFEIAAGRHMVRPRYEVVRQARRRIAHPNVERTDLVPAPELPALAPLLGKGFILPAPILPPTRWASALLPTPMARSQRTLPIQAIAYAADGRVVGEHRFGRLERRDSVVLEFDQFVDLDRLGSFGHVELTYDWTVGDEADGWLHALLRYTDRASDHVAESSFGAHIFNTVMTWRDEPQSYSGPPPGLSTRLFLRLGHHGLDTLCHLIYPASTPWHPMSTTTLKLRDAGGAEVAEKRVAIACGGSLFWRFSEMFDASERAAAAGGSVQVRDATCRLFGYHGLLADDGRFSLDHMFGF